VTDSTGAVIFESGAFNPDGSIVGNANDEDPAAFEPHYTTLTAAPPSRWRSTPLLL
jgi:hypothetical protein